MAKSSRSPDRRRRRSRSRSNSSSCSSSDEDRRHSRFNRRPKKSRSRSRTRSKDGSNSKSKMPSRSLSRERKRRRSRSKGRSPSSSSKKEFSKSDKGKRSTETTTGASSSMTPEEQLKNKMKMALKAAAEADAQLREKGVLTSRNKLTKEKMTSEPLSFQEQINRSDAITQINAPGFAPQDFISNADKQQTNDPSGSSATDLFSYDNQANKSSIAATMEKLVQCELAHENLFANKELRQEKWVRRLYTMRQKRLNGDVMS